MADFRTTTRFAAQGLTQTAREGLERIRLADKAVFDNLQVVSALEEELAGANPNTYVAAYAKVHVANYNVDHAKTLADLHRRTLMDSIDVTCGALLALAKQGISRIHHGLGACPPGRLIGNTPLRDVVWQARNQAAHCEEGRYSPAVLAVFAALEADYGSAFHLVEGVTENLATMVVLIIDWLNDSVYDADITSLLG
jgi:hypothetical protein